MCCGPFDYDYPTFGGKHPRANRSHGRVGSILSDPITTLTGPSADSNLTEPPEPLAVDAGETDIDLEDNDLDEDNEDIFGESDSDEDLKLDSLEEELERIEPLKSDDATEKLDIEAKSTEAEAADDSTASTRWRPRPLR